MAPLAFELLFTKTLMTNVDGYIPQAKIIIGNEPHDATLVWNASISGFDITVYGIEAGTVTTPSTGNNYFLSVFFYPCSYEGNQVFSPVQNGYHEA